MIGLLIRGAVNLARTVEYAIQAGGSFVVSFVGFLLLAGLGATESGVDRHVISIITIVSTLMPVASGLAVAILGFGGARFSCIMIATG